MLTTMVEKALNKVNENLNPDSHWNMLDTIAGFEPKRLIETEESINSFYNYVESTSIEEAISSIYDSLDDATVLTYSLVEETVIKLMGVKEYADIMQIDFSLEETLDSFEQLHIENVIVLGVTVEKTYYGFSYKNYMFDAFEDVQEIIHVMNLYKRYKDEDDDYDCYGYDEYYPDEDEYFNDQEWSEFCEWGNHLD